MIKTIRHKIKLNPTHTSTRLLRVLPLLLLVIPFSQTHANPVCSSADADSDGDGWGWENHRSCLVNPVDNNQNNNPTNNNNHDPVCSSASSDPDGDGWGWENHRSCRVTASTGNSGNTSTDVSSQSQNSSQDNSDSNTVPVCASVASDDNRDGWGFENGRSCIVTSDSADIATVAGLDDATAPPPVAASTPGYINGQPICLTDSSDAGNDGFGYENGKTCIVTDATATRDNPLLNQRSCIPWLEISYGNYRLQNNTWNDGDVWSDNWYQCIELTKPGGKYTANWDYDWLGRTEGNEYAVKSYPQVYYGRKTRYNLSGSVAETGLPASVNGLEQFWVDFDFSETGIVERNVALESFFHTSCDAENYNKQFEMMVWVGVPSIRTPGTLLTSVTLSGYEWDVYANPSLGWAYVAFVAKTPFNRGTLDWNAFVNWSKDQGPAFGVPAMARNVCMGAIELGTETFWGSGTFTLNEFRVRR